MDDLNKELKDFKKRMSPRSSVFDNPTEDDYNEALLDVKLANKSINTNKKDLASVYREPNFFKRVYFSLEDKYYSLVEFLHLQKAVDKIDNFLPSFPIFLSLFFILLILLVVFLVIGSKTSVEFSFLSENNLIEDRIEVKFYNSSGLNKIVFVNSKTNVKLDMGENVVVEVLTPPYEYKENILINKKKYDIRIPKKLTPISSKVKINIFDTDGFTLFSSPVNAKITCLNTNSESNVSITRTYDFEKRDNCGIVNVKINLNGFAPINKNCEGSVCDITITLPSNNLSANTNNPQFGSVIVNVFGIIDGNRTPLEDMDVSIRYKNTQELARPNVKTSSIGRSELSSIPVGDYRISVSKISEGISSFKDVSIAQGINSPINFDINIDAIILANTKSVDLNLRFSSDVNSDLYPSCKSLLTIGYFEDNNFYELSSAQINCVSNLTLGRLSIGDRYNIKITPQTPYQNSLKSIDANVLINANTQSLVYELEEFDYKNDTNVVFNVKYLNRPLANETIVVRKIGTNEVNIPLTLDENGSANRMLSFGSYSVSQIQDSCYSISYNFTLDRNPNATSFVKRDVNITATLDDVNLEVKSNFTSLDLYLNDSLKETKSVTNGNAVFNGLQSCTNTFYLKATKDNTNYYSMREVLTSRPYVFNHSSPNSNFNFLGVYNSLNSEVEQINYDQNYLFVFDVNSNVNTLNVSNFDVSDFSRSVRVVTNNDANLTIANATNSGVYRMGFLMKLKSIEDSCPSSYIGPNGDQISFMNGQRFFCDKNLCIDVYNEKGCIVSDLSGQVNLKEGENNSKLSHNFIFSDLSSNFRGYERSPQSNRFISPIRTSNSSLISNYLVDDFNVHLKDVNSRNSHIAFSFGSQQNRISKYLIYNIGIDYNAYVQNNIIYDFNAPFNIVISDDLPSNNNQDLLCSQNSSDFTLNSNLDDYDIVFKIGAVDLNLKEIKRLSNSLKTASKFSTRDNLSQYDSIRNLLYGFEYIDDKLYVKRNSEFVVQIKRDGYLTKTFEVGVQSVPLVYVCANDLNIDFGVDYPLNLEGTKSIIENSMKIFNRSNPNMQITSSQVSFNKDVLNQDLIDVNFNDFNLEPLNVGFNDLTYNNLVKINSLRALSSYPNDAIMTIRNTTKIGSKDVVFDANVKLNFILPEQINMACDVNFSVKNSNVLFGKGIILSSIENDYFEISINPDSNCGFVSKYLFKFSLTDSLFDLPSQTNTITTDEVDLSNLEEGEFSVFQIDVPQDYTDRQFYNNPNSSTRPTQDFRTQEPFDVPQERVESPPNYEEGTDSSQSSLQENTGLLNNSEPTQSSQYKQLRVGFNNTSSILRFGSSLQTIVSNNGDYRVDLSSKQKLSGKYLRVELIPIYNFANQDRLLDSHRRVVFGYFNESRSCIAMRSSVSSQSNNYYNLALNESLELNITNNCLFEIKYSLNNENTYTEISKNETRSVTFNKNNSISGINILSLYNKDTDEKIDEYYVNVKTSNKLGSSTPWYVDSAIINNERGNIYLKKSFELRWPQFGKYDSFSYNTQYAKYKINGSNYELYTKEYDSFNDNNLNQDKKEFYEIYVKLNKENSSGFRILCPHNTYILDYKRFDNDNNFTLSYDLSKLLNRNKVLIVDKTINTQYNEYDRYIRFGLICGVRDNERQYTYDKNSEILNVNETSNINAIKEKYKVYLLKRDDLFSSSSLEQVYSCPLGGFTEDVILPSLLLDDANCETNICSLETLYDYTNKVITSLNSRTQYNSSVYLADDNFTNENLVSLQGFLTDSLNLNLTVQGMGSGVYDYNLLIIESQGLFGLIYTHNITLTKRSEFDKNMQLYSMPYSKSEGQFGSHFSSNFKYNNIESYLTTGGLKSYTKDSNISLQNIEILKFRNNFSYNNKTLYYIKGDLNYDTNKDLFVVGDNTYFDFVLEKDDQKYSKESFGLIVNKFSKYSVIGEIPDGYTAKYIYISNSDFNGSIRVESLFDISQAIKIGDICVHKSGVFENYYFNI